MVHFVDLHPADRGSNKARHEIYRDTYALKTDSATSPVYFGPPETLPCGTKLQVGLLTTSAIVSVVTCGLSFYHRRPTLRCSDSIPMTSATQSDHPDDAVDTGWGGPELSQACAEDHRGTAVQGC